MAIDARVVGIRYTFDVGSQGHLLLEDRPGKSGKPYGIKGQSRLYFESAPAWVADLIDQDIWGSANSIIYKDQEIATRKGYTSIVFTAAELHGLGPAAAKRAGKS